MTFEARLVFILFFFLAWFVAGLIPWAGAAVVVRGRGSLLALPLALAAAALAGLLLPLFGQRDLTGFLLSLPLAAAGGLLGSVAGILISRGLQRSPAASHAPAGEEQSRDSSRSIR